ncbi:MAG TPA: NADH-quinone oxidoreductase subunit J [Egibacteraceae bacterium]|nr:NADH-quinone oxidoreductase subunit J [Egibacteraceae bacterium]
MAEFWVFWILAPISLGSAIAMILMRNAVHSALLLVLNFFTLAAFYAVLEAQFLAVVQIVVYAGAIMVLFLFVLMLLGIARDDPIGGPLRGQKPAALLLGVLLVASLSVGVAGPWMGQGSVCGAEADVTAGAQGRPCAGLADVNAQEGGNIRQLGLLLFTDYVWPFEVTSVLLVIAALGAMVLGRRKEHPSELVDMPREQLPAVAGRRATPPGREGEGTRS